MTGQKQEPKKITKRDFRAMMNKEPMLNGKRFEECTRLELFEMYLSLIKNVRELVKANNILAKENMELRGENLPITEEIADAALEVVAEFVGDDENGEGEK